MHHASNPEYLDCNYGSSLIVFDRLFGTFTALRADIRIRYGLTKPVLSHNPIRIAFNEWLAMGRDVRRGAWRAGSAEGAVRAAVRPATGCHDPPTPGQRAADRPGPVRATTDPASGRWARSVDGRDRRRQQAVGDVSLA